MKIALASDLHLEFGSISLENDGADVLILSGDILVANDLKKRDVYDIKSAADRSNKFHTFFQEVCARFPHVIYVMGNHEHYHGDFKHTLESLRNNLGYLSNLHILEKEYVTLGDVTFIGGTLWTDMNKGDALTLYHIKSMMNDFRIVNNSNREVHFKDTEGKSHTRAARLCPEDVLEEHDKMKEFIRQTIEGKFNDKFVVVGHHSPSKQSTKPRYKDDALMNGGYSSDLSEFILDHPQIKVWTHGHTHDKFDYMIGTTRVICNPRGYIDYEDCADRFALEYFEV
jgi:predicted phosphodiesterase